MNTNKEMKSVWLWVVVGLAVLLFALLFWLMRGSALPEIGSIENVNPTVTNVVPQVNNSNTQEFGVNANIEVTTEGTPVATQEATVEEVVTNPDDTVPGEPLDPAIQDTLNQ